VDDDGRGDDSGADQGGGGRPFADKKKNPDGVENRFQALDQDLFDGPQLLGGQGNDDEGQAQLENTHEENDADFARVDRLVAK